MRQYPIWNIIKSCAYKSDKSYGVKADGVVKVRMGTSSVNSHPFLTHRTTCKTHVNNMKEFRFYVDDKCVKRKFVDKGEIISTHKAKVRLSKYLKLPLIVASETLKI